MTAHTNQVLTTSVEHKQELGVCDIGTARAKINTWMKNDTPNYVTQYCKIELWSNDQTLNGDTIIEHPKITEQNHVAIIAVFFLSLWSFVPVCRFLKFLGSLNVYCLYCFLSGAQFMRFTSTWPIVYTLRPRKNAMKVFFWKLSQPNLIISILFESTKCQ